MPDSVVERIFAYHEAVTGVRLKGEGRGGRGGGRGVQKAPPPRPPRRTFPTSITDITAKIKMEKAVRALSTIQVCKKRQGELAAQLMPLPAVGPAYRSLGSDTAPRRDPDEQAVYDEERARLAAIRREAEDELDRLFGAEVGPPLDLQAAVQQRKAVVAQLALEAQMADMAMQEPESPAAVYASPGNTNPHLGGLGDYVHHGETPPAFRSIGTDD